ncbi:hypothetical protein KAR10_03010 [bacterium]|nr:hypothetical protein [bacterium]
METILTPNQHLIFVTLTSYMAVLGGALLWGGFILMGIISRRLELVYGIITHWQFQIIAPMGLFIYLMMQSIASLRHQNMGPVEQWTGYTLLIWSAGLSLWGIYRFWRVLKVLERGRN